MRTALIVPVLVLIACSEPAGVDRAVTVETPQVWSGGEIVIASLAFRGIDTLPEVRIGDSLVTARVIEPGRIAIIASSQPDTLVLAIRLSDGSRRSSPPVIVGGGFVRSGDGAFLSYAIAWPGPARQLIANVVSPTRGVVAIDLESPGQMIPILPDSLAHPFCLQVPGISHDGGLVLVGMDSAAFTCNLARRFSGPLNALAPLDSQPPLGNGTAAFVGNGRWLMHSKHTIWALETGTATRRIAEGDWSGEFHWSADRTRIAALGNGGRIHGGRIVMNAEAFDIAFRLPDEEANGAFSPTGDTLFVAAVRGGFTGARTQHLYAVQGRDGSLLTTGDSIPLDGLSTDVADFTFHDVAVDTRGPWLFLLGEFDANGPRVRVIDRRTMRTVGTLVVPAGAVPPSAPSSPREPRLLGFVTASPRALHVVQLEPISGQPSRFYKFSLLP